MQAADSFDRLEFLTRVLMHVPEPRRHLVRYYGAHSNAARGKRRRLQKVLAGWPSRAAARSGDTDEDRALDARTLRRLWAEMIKRVYEVDPLVRERCGGEMRVVAFTIDPQVVDRILRHLVLKANHRVRGPTWWADLEAAL